MSESAGPLRLVLAGLLIFALGIAVGMTDLRRGPAASPSQPGRSNNVTVQPGANPQPNRARPPQPLAPSEETDREIAPAPSHMATTLDEESSLSAARSDWQAIRSQATASPSAGGEIVPTAGTTDEPGMPFLAPPLLAQNVAPSSRREKTGNAPVNSAKRKPTAIGKPTPPVSARATSPASMDEAPATSQSANRNLERPKQQPAPLAEPAALPATSDDNMAEVEPALDGAEETTADNAAASSATDSSDVSETESTDTAADPSTETAEADNSQDDESETDQPASDKAETDVPEVDEEQPLSNSAEETASEETARDQDRSSNDAADTSSSDAIDNAEEVSETPADKPDSTDGESSAGEEPSIDDDSESAEQPSSDENTSKEEVAPQEDAPQRGDAPSQPSRADVEPSGESASEPGTPAPFDGDPGDREAGPLAKTPSEETDVPPAASPQSEHAPKLRELTPQERAQPLAEPPSAKLPPLNSEMLQLRDRLHQVLGWYYQRPVNSRDNTPWEVFHWIIAYNVHAELNISGNQRGNAVAWLCVNRACHGQRLLTVEHGRIKALYGVGVQGHEGQFLAILAQSHVPDDYPMHAGNQSFKVSDLIESEKLGCKSGTELTFKLIGLSHYLGSEAEWNNSSGETWSVSRLVHEELAKPIQGSACGGTHRLMGLSYACRVREWEGLPMDGEFARAKQYIQEYQQYAMKLQNVDGSFSTKWLAGREARPDIDRRIQTTGHILEWLVFSLSDEQLRHPRVVKTVDYLAQTLAKNPRREWKIGPLGHSLRALFLYENRVFAPLDEDLHQVAEDEPETDQDEVDDESAEEEMEEEPRLAVETEDATSEQNVVTLESPVDEGELGTVHRATRPRDGAKQDGSNVVQRARRREDTATKPGSKTGEPRRLR